MKETKTPFYQQTNPYYPDMVSDQNVNCGSGCSCKREQSIEKQIFPQGFDNSDQQNNNNAQNENWGNFTNNYPQDTPQKQKNLFGSLNPEQLMTMLTTKGNLSSLLGSLGSSNPQLAMLMGLLQNMPKTKKQSTQPTEEKEEEKEKKYIKVKDYYKENDEQKS